MSTKPTLHFFCGKMAAGKSTLAKRLAKESRAILLVEDEWLAKLYPDEIIDIPSYIKYSHRLKEAITGHVNFLLSGEISVVLDFPANTIEQRRWFKLLIETSTVHHELHFVDATNDVCKRQLKERSKDKPDGAAFTSEAEFDAITKYFQAPSHEEGFNIVRYERA
jgi:predicted kinase